MYVVGADAHIGPLQESADPPKTDKSGKFFRRGDVGIAPYD